jgi:hypothetical protein
VAIKSARRHVGSLSEQIIYLVMADELASEPMMPQEMAEVSYNMILGDGLRSFAAIKSSSVYQLRNSAAVFWRTCDRVIIIWERSMKNLVLLTAMLACVCQANTAFAQQYDFSEMTCATFLQNSAQTQRDTAIWFAGLYTDIAQSQVMDLTSIADFQNKLATFCRQQPSFRIATAAEGILGR